MGLNMEKFACVNTMRRFNTTSLHKFQFWALLIGPYFVALLRFKLAYVIDLLQNLVTQQMF